MRNILGLLLTLTVLSACANTGLRDLRPPAEGPDEFIVEPKAALEQPANFTDLPPPTPGGINRTDKFPIQEATTALGGRPTSADAGIPARDGALVTAASRFGVSPNIRATLAADDEDFRRRKARFTQFRIVPVDRYNEAYRREALNPALVAGQWRAAGARTPAYPPPPRRRIQ